MAKVIPDAARTAGPHIGGVETRTEHWQEFRDPYRGDLVSRVAISSADTVGAAVDRARVQQEVVAGMSNAQRAMILRSAADLIESRADDLATTVSRQIGKAIRSTRREVRRSAWTLRAAATAAEDLSGVIPASAASPEGSGLVALGLRVPVGVVGAITPFNAPFNLVAHKIAPAFAAGNAVVVKPASQTALSALDLVAILEEAGVPPGAINVVPGNRDTVSGLVSHPGVSLFTFTGGRVAAEAISRQVGTRRALYELGGNSPNIVHEDADLDGAVAACASGGFANTGQSCNSVQRIFVHESIAAPFTERLIERVRGLRVGDPLDEQTDIGTLVNVEAAKRVEQWIHDASNHGARVLIGGGREDAILQPTVVSQVPDDARLVCEEVFGPVVVILPYRDLDEAIERANASDFGLQAAIFTRSLSVAFDAARRLQAGGVLVNRSTNFRLDHLPYGGVKQSGVGREGPAYAVQEMTELKLVLVDPQSATPTR